MANLDPIQEARQLAATPQGQQLAALLQKLGGNDLQTALNQAAAGDYTQAKAALSVLLQNDEARRLLQQLGN